MIGQLEAIERCVESADCGENSRIARTRAPLQDESNRGATNYGQLTGWAGANQNASWFVPPTISLGA